MVTYVSSTRNQFRSPSGAVNEAPDGPGAFQTLAQDIDDRIGWNGIEYAATTAIRDAIPTARKFTGKRVRVAADGITYVWSGTNWVPWESSPQNVPITTNNLTQGNGTVVHSQWWQNGILHGKWALTWGSTSGAGAAILPVFGGAGMLTTGAADLAYPHIGHGFVNKVGTGIQPTVCRLDNGFRFAMWAPGATVAVHGTNPYTLAAGDTLGATYAVKYL
jgi:hypothetical protein